MQLYVFFSKFLCNLASFFKSMLLGALSPVANGADIGHRFPRIGDLVAICPAVAALPTGLWHKPAPTTRTMQHTVLQLVQHTVLQLVQHTVLQLVQHTVLQLVQHTVLQLVQHTVLQLVQHTVLQLVQHTVLQLVQHLNRDHRKTDDWNKIVSYFKKWLILVILTQRMYCRGQQLFSFTLFQMDLS